MTQVPQSLTRLRLFCHLLLSFELFTGYLVRYPPFPPSPSLRLSFLAPALAPPRAGRVDGVSRATSGTLFKIARASHFLRRRRRRGRPLLAVDAADRGGFLFSCRRDFSAARGSFATGAAPISAPKWRCSFDRSPRVSDELEETNVSSAPFFRPEGICARDTDDYRDTRDVNRAKPPASR